jgi:CelD/BcsL family acetyltransferase involved in cellulose biosynthesis
MTWLTGSEDAAGVLGSLAPSATADGTLGFDVTADPATLEADWRELETRSVGGPFQRFDFYRSWIAEHGARRRPLVVTARRAGRLVAVFPLVARRMGPVTVAEFAGASHATCNAGVFDRIAWRSAAPTLASGLRAAVIDSGAGVDLVRLTYQPAEIDGLPNPFVDATSRPSAHAAYDLSLDGGFAAVLDRHKGSKKRRRVRQQAAAFEAAGGYRVRRAETVEDALRILETFKRQKAERLASQGLPNVFAEPGTPEFLAELVTRAYDPRGLDHPALLVYALETDRGIGATGFLHAWSGTTYLVMNSFEQDEFARWAPGELTLFHMIEDVAGLGFERFDFGIGDARYKRSWCDREIVLYDTLMPLSPTGVVAAGITALGRRAADGIRANPRLHRLAQRIRCGRTAGRDTEGPEDGGE